MNRSTRVALVALTVAGVAFFSCCTVGGNKTNSSIGETFHEYTPAEIEALVAEVKVDDKLVWQDDFAGTTLDTSCWTKEIVPRDGETNYNKESQSYVDSAETCVVSGGTLKINAVKDAGGNWTSARLNTSGKKDFTYGYFEAKVKVPADVGTWPAFWLLGETDRAYASSVNNNTGGWWPNCGEIDIFEHRNPADEGGISLLNSAMHRFAGSGGYGTGTGTISETGFTDGNWHTAACYWDANVVAFFWDGTLKQLTYNYNNNGDNSSGEYSAGTTYAYNRLAPFASYFSKNWMWYPYNHNFYIILNLAMGGWGGTVDSSLTSSTFEVDYVKVWQN